jgi:oligosaccharide repeat unit polymerase
MFSTEELAYILLLSVLTLSVFIKSLLSKDNLQIWNPLTFISIFFIYYTLLGPIFSVSNDNTFFRNVDHRPYLIVGWRCALVSFVSIIIGYNILTTSKRVRKSYSLSPTILKTAGLNSFYVCIFFLIIYAGIDFTSRLNFWDNQTSSVGYSGSFGSYLMHSVNFFITSTAILLLYGLKSKKFILFIIVFAISASLFLNEAFRFRLVILILSSISIYYQYINKRPNLILLSIAAVLFVFLMGVIEYSRSYGQGIDIERLENIDNEKILEGGLNESSVFSSTAYLISKVDDGTIPNTRFAMFSNALASPVPRQLWPGKPNGEYFLNTMENIYGIYFKGQAMLFFGEYYLSFGWLGLIFFSFLIGVLFKSVWLWFLRNRRNELAIAAISIFNCFIYVIVSRGYLTQVITLFFFTVYPIFFVIQLHKKRLLK